MSERCNPSKPDDDYEVSTDMTRLDLDFICRALAGSYWAAERPRAKVEASIRASLCFGAYARASGRQVGFARIVTDGVTYSWLCDVIVDEAERGRGVGKLLVSSVVAHPVVRELPCQLATRDAHGLYEKFGFKRWESMRRPGVLAGQCDRASEEVARDGSRAAS